MEILTLTLIFHFLNQIQCLNNDGPPVFTEQPKSHLAERSKDVRLYCRAKGVPTPNITWFKDGSSIQSVTIRGVVHLPVGDLLFLKVRDKGEGANTGMYQCRAENKYGVIFSNNASVELASIDNDFRKEPVDQRAAVGQQVTMACHGPRGIPEPGISWTKNDLALVPNKRIEILPGGDLVISNLKKSDSGSYICVARNAAGERASHAAILKVKELPRISIKPSNAEVEIGETHDLVCRATGDPKPRLKWTKKHGKISKKFNQLNNGNLRMNKVEIEDEGQYICTATNSVGKAAVSANVTVLVTPKIIESSDVMTSQVGDTSTLTCTVEGRPKPTIFWTNPNGIELFMEKTHDNGRIRVATSGDLIINYVRFEDQGVYTCHAATSRHTVTANIRLNVLKKLSKIPPPIIALPPSNITVEPKSSTVLACLSQNSTIRWYKDGKLIPIGAGRFHLDSSGNLTINNIQKSDKGQYTCKATNQHGIDEWTAWVDVGNTQSGSQKNNLRYLPKPLGKPTIVNSTSECLSISWTKTENENFPILFYIVAYFRVGSAGTRWHKTSPVYERVYQLCGLQPSSKYEFIVRGVNEKGAGRASPVSELLITRDEVVATMSNTLKSLDDVTVEIIKATPLATQRSLRIEWSTNGSCDSLDGFMVISQPVSVISSDLYTGQTPCTARTYELVNLAAHTKYEVRVRPLKNQRAGLASPIKFLSAEAGLMPAATPQLLSVSKNSNSNDVTAVWEPPNDLPAAHVIGYVIRYWSRDEKFERKVNVNSTTTKFSIKDLPQEAATYDVTVTYKTRMGEGLTSESVAVTTDLSRGIFDQPWVIAAIAGGATALLFVVILVIYCCRKSRRKTTEYHGSSRYRNNRYNPATYPSPRYEFEIKPRDYQGGATGNLDLLREGQQRNEGDISEMKLLQHQQPDNVTKSNMMSYTSSNGEFRSQTVDSNEIMDGINCTVRSTGFSYVSPQHYNAGDATRNECMRANNMTSPQSSSIQQQALHRKRSGGSTYSSSNFSDAETRRQYINLKQNVSVTELPPPPVSPPQSTVSQRSHTSSGRRSTAERSSRSGQRANRSAVPNKFPPSYAAYGLPEDSEIGYSSHVGSSLLVRTSANDIVSSSIPPTPPIRGDSNTRAGGRSRQQYDHKAYFTAPNTAEMLYSTGENNELGQLQVRQHIPNYDCRNSANVSNFSMINGYGSESDTRESFHDRHSEISSSDVESFQMESASQIGQNLNESGDCQSGVKTSFPLGGDSLQKRNYPSTYHHYSAEAHSSEQHVNPYTALLSNRKTASALNPRKRDPLKRANSSSSCASSYHQNTGDSGMSAGVGCSTEHSSSLNSHASAGSGNKNLFNRTNHNTLPPSIGEMLPYEDAALPLNHYEDVSLSMDRDLHQSTQSSAVPMRYHPKHKATQSTRSKTSRLPVSIQRPHQNSPDSRWHTNASNSHRVPLSPIQSPGQELEYLDASNVGHQLENLKLLRKPERDSPVPRQLSDVPEVSTSDFCEDYSDQSQ